MTRHDQLNAETAVDRPVEGSAPPQQSRSFGLLWRVAALLTLALFPIGLLAVVQTNAALKGAEQSYQSTLQAQTARAARPEREAIYDAFGLARGLAAAVSVLDPADAACAELMTRSSEDAPGILFLGFADENAVSRCNNLGEVYDFSDTPNSKRLYADPAPNVSFNPAGEATGEAVVIVSEPVYRPDGTFGGFVSLSFSSTALSNIRSDSPLNGTSFFLTFAAGGDVLSSDVPREQIAPLLPQGRDLARLGQPERYSFTAVGEDGISRFYSVVPIVDQTAYAISGWQVPAQFGPGWPYMSTLVFPLLMWLVSLAVSIFALRRLVILPVLTLGRRMRSFADGRRILHPDSMKSAPRELRDIGQNFEMMADKILHDEADLEDRLREREILVKEIHHRVKNNLQLMSSIMSMQARRETSVEGRMALRDVQDRLASLAAVHRGLYEGPALSMVRADELLGDILKDLTTLTDTKRERRIELLLDPLELVPDQAVPLAMLATEGFTNAAKHFGDADAAKHNGEPDTAKHIGEPDTAKHTGEGPPVAGQDIQVRLTRIGEDTAQLQIVNSLSGNEAEDAVPGLGQQLIAAFVQQLHGETSVEATARSYCLTVTFPILPFREKSD